MKKYVKKIYNIFLIYNIEFVYDIFSIDIFHHILVKNYKNKKEHSRIINKRYYGQFPYNIFKKFISFGFRVSK